MSRAMAVELSPLGIRINVVAPGPIQTPISERLQLPPEQREAVKQKLSSMVPLGRYGDAEEVAKVVLFLASDDSSFVNASEIVVDGGVTGACLARRYIGSTRDGASVAPPLLLAVSTYSQRGPRHLTAACRRFGCGARRSRV